jgi:DNA-binding transcriptional LysR family regulator
MITGSISAMNEQQMRSFIGVAKHRSISRAAEELNISQQGLSRVITVIENELGAKLFARSAGGVELTDSGSMILPAVASMLKSYEEYMTIINVIIEKRKETITITHEHATSLTRIPFAITSQLKDINFKILIAGTIENCMAQVLNGTADIGFCHRCDNFDELKYIPVIDEPVTVFMSRDHELAGKNELVLSDLDGVPQLFPGVVLPKSAIEYLEDCVKQGFYPDYKLSSDDPDILLKAIRDKNSVILGSRYLFSATPDDIIGIPLIYESKKVEMGFLVKIPAGKSVLSFIEAVKQYYERSM